jgi:hypothetical protein
VAVGNDSEGRASSAERTGKHLRKAAEGAGAKAGTLLAGSGGLGACFGESTRLAG